MVDVDGYNPIFVWRTSCYECGAFWFAFTEIFSAVSDESPYKLIQATLEHSLFSLSCNIVFVIPRIAARVLKTTIKQCPRLSTPVQWKSPQKFLRCLQPCVVSPKCSAEDALTDKIDSCTRLVNHNSLEQQVAVRYSSSKQFLTTTHFSTTFWH